MKRPSGSPYDDLLIQTLRRDLAALRSSARWRLGDGVISLIERIIGRRAHHSAMEHMERMIQLWETAKTKDHDRTPFYEDWVAYDWSDVTPSTTHHIALLCSHDQPGPHREGDYYTAMELADAINKIEGFDAILISNIKDLKKNTNTLISLLHDTPISSVADDIMCIAWVRSHGAYWIKRPWFDRFDLFLCSSHQLAEFIGQLTYQPVHLFPIATNPSRMAVHKDATPEVDVVFIGSNRPKSPRRLTGYLAELDEEVSLELYGANWQEVEGLRAHDRGFIHYEDVPSAYAKARSVIDSGHEESLLWGSLNSRVFDGFATGRPVLSDNTEGYRALFGDDTLTFTDGDTLQQLVDHARDRSPAFMQAFADVRAQVLLRHTYSHRASLLSAILRHASDTRWDIHLHIATTDGAVVDQWGDYHMAAGLKAAFTTLGHRCRIVLADHALPSATADLDLHICGLRPPRKTQGRMKASWVISHIEAHRQHLPDMDVLFASSQAVADYLATPPTRSSPVLLHQCTDAARYRPSGPIDEQWTGHIIYVGHQRPDGSRMLGFDFIKYHVHLIGRRWSDQVPASHIIAEELDTASLATVYRSARAIIVDHHPDMKAYGVHSNKVYDILSAGGKILCDIPSGHHLSSYGDRLIHYRDHDHLAELVSETDGAIDSAASVSPYQGLRDTHLHRAMAILAATQDELRHRR